MSNSLNFVSSFDLEKMVLDLWCCVSELEQKVQTQAIINEIKNIKTKIVKIKEELRRRVRVK
jgi:hypothetical protein